MNQKFLFSNAELESSDPAEWWMICPECNRSSFLEDWEIMGMGSELDEEELPEHCDDSHVSCPWCLTLVEINWKKTKKPCPECQGSGHDPEQ